jgi:hypothetical protein
MQLGQSEQLLIQLETKLYRHIKFGEDLGDVDYFTIDLLLKNWIFGLYEILRSLERMSGQCGEGKEQAIHMQMSIDI